MYQNWSCMDGYVTDVVRIDQKYLMKHTLTGLDRLHQSTAWEKYCSEAIYVEPRSSESTSYMSITLALNSEADDWICIVKNNIIY